MDPLILPEQKCLQNVNKTSQLIWGWAVPESLVLYKLFAFYTIYIFCFHDTFESPHIWEMSFNTWGVMNIGMGGAEVLFGEDKF